MDAPLLNSALNPARHPPLNPPSNPASNRSAAGISDAVWWGELHGAPAWQPRATHSLLVVSPHPDDETFGAGGLIAMWAERQSQLKNGADGNLPPRVTVLSVTDGEASHPGCPGLARIRRAELRHALQILAGTNVGLVHLGLPDGQIHLHKDCLAEAIHAHLTANTTLIAPFEHDGHPDHECVGAVCRAAALARDIDIARYPIEAWHHGAPAVVGPRRWGRVELSSQARVAKACAMRCFESQTTDIYGTPIVPGHVLRYFRRSYEAFLI